jgi:hypothetical protein
MRLMQYVLRLHSLWRTGSTLRKPVHYGLTTVVQFQLVGWEVDMATKNSSAKKSVSLSVGRGEKLPVSQGAGLTAKGREKYNAATGSNLKAPQPQGGARKDSFCARMSGVPGPMKDEKGNPTRKAAALARWKC